MNKPEMRKIIASMMAIYPTYNVRDIDLTVGMWLEVMGEYSYVEVSLALQSYMRSSTSGFAPTPGQLIELIHTTTRPDEPNEMEAWSMVSNAIRNSGYNYAEEYSKLPLLIRKAVGTPEQLRAWALDEKFNEEVASSNFMRCYRAEAKRAHERSKMSPEVQRMIAEVVAKNAITTSEQKEKEMPDNILSMERKRAEVPVDAMDRVQEIWRKRG